MAELHSSWTRDFDVYDRIKALGIDLGKKEEVKRDRPERKERPERRPRREKRTLYQEIARKHACLCREGWQSRHAGVHCAEARMGSPS